MQNVKYKMQNDRKQDTRRRRPGGGRVAEIRALLPQCMLQDRVRIEAQLQGWLRGRRDPKVLTRLADQAARSAKLLDRRRRRRPKITYPEDLPLVAVKDEILQAVRAHPVVVVAGETGSGKTTQLPKICLEAGRGLAGKIACTQPRRVAALSVSRRIAEELGVAWGREVGCKIRFKDETAPETYIKMMTDGMLLAETQGDSLLHEYDTIIIDEAHERSLNIDFLLGYLRVLRKKRPDLKLIITSATIDTEAFSRAFDDAPVIQVSGRLYPVEVRYRPMEEVLEEGSEFTYIDALVQAVDEVVAASPRSDMLVFLPTEKDIHETRRRLEGRSYRHTEILPLFGRLTPADQQRVFSVGGRRRIVVATNVAETSLTIPGIRYVIDTGLARLSRYNARTQTHRLPIEPISQSSAQQRAGRCGRVSGGICIRLYSESDFLSRPVYTQPEIQRANLAEVILRMLALKLGDVETFPFIDPPRPQAIQGGFQLLHELGALDEGRRLTRMGRDMARLPIAPTVSRMVLQAHKEGALREVLVIASAISIQDPRVRPLEQEAEADREHRKFVHKESDFLALLNIWNAYHDTLEEMKTQGSMRRFCRQHYLSYNRMREWRDIYVQIRHTLREIGGMRWNREDADYEGIHRSVLAGLLSNIAQKKEHNLYNGARGREAMIFPGSGLFQRKAPKVKRGRGNADDVQEKAGTPGWIVAAEIVETSRVFARTAARIQPEWLSEVGAHLCRASYKDPHWNARAGRVLVTETLTLYGLQVRTQRVPYSRVDPKEATEIFIRSALGNDEVLLHHAFLAHNRQLRERVETWQMRMRHAQGLDIDEAVYAFYARRLEGVSSVHDLNRVVREKRQADSEFLFMKAADLVGELDVGFDRDAFPEYMEMDGEKLRLAYAYRPGEEADGVTLKMPYKLMYFVRPEVLEWLVPGLLEEKITHLMRGLPGGIRKQFVPVPETAREIAARLQPTHDSLLASLEAHILERYGVQIGRADWRAEDLPAHLRMRVEVQGEKGQTVTAGRDLGELVDSLDRQEAPAASKAWRQAVKAWEQEDLKDWTFGDLPERVEVTQIGGLPVYGYPGLRTEGKSVSLRLFRDRDEAQEATWTGLIRLYEMALKDEVKWLKRQLQDLKGVVDAGWFGGGSGALQEAAYAHLAEYLFGRDEIYPLTQVRFELGMAEGLEKLPGLAPRFIELMKTLLETYREIRLLPHAYPEMESDLARLMPDDFLRRVAFAQLSHMVRYLKAVQMRAERARLGAGKDRQKAEGVRPFQKALDQLLQEDLPPTSARRAQIETYRWMVEEFRVSVFAQELGTAQPVSAKRLNEKLEEIRQMK